MDDRTYQMHDVETGTHILIFVDKGDGHAFERKVFVPLVEYRQSSLGSVLTKDFRSLYAGPHTFVVEWLKKNRHVQEAKMVAVGEDFQLFGISEYLSRYA